MPSKESVDEKTEHLVKALEYKGVKPGAVISGQKIDYVFIEVELTA
nr:hypothetical protein [Candidatus Brachybacter algidus]